MTTTRTRPETGYAVEIPPVMPEPARILIEARELIADERHWCQNQWFFMDGRYRSLGAIGQAAVGAPAYGWEKTNAGIAAAGFLQRSIDDSPTVVHFNDSHTHAEVLAAFDRAIKLALT